MNEPKAAFPRHFYSLDALRGLAALCVVFWHWQHFFFSGWTSLPAGWIAPMKFQPERQPFFAIFKFLYENGGRAVDIFFCLSGFIFFWLYSEKIGRRAISFKQFAILRFSRLYPLHFATLMLVAALQAVFFKIFRYFFVYQQNNPYHFVLQLFLATSWGFKRGDSFNGPIWSVSVEVLLYGLFFLLCRTGWRRWWQLLLMVGAGYVAYRHDHTLLGRGLISFFAGGLTFQLCAYLARRGFPQWAPHVAGLIAALLWLCFPLLGRPDIFLPELLLYPSTILALALWELKRGALGQRLAFLGQISYSSYLLHFPLEICFVLVCHWLSLPETFFYTPAAMVIFFSILAPLSLASFHYFELPCQAWLRARMLPSTVKNI